MVGIHYFRIGELVFNEARMYGCLSSVVIDDLDVRIKLLRVVIICCVPSLEEFL